MNLVVNLPQELDIGRPIQNEHSLELPVKPPKVVPVCPHCHSAGCVSKGSDGFQSIRHVPSGNTGVFLTFKKQRFYCAECHASFTYHYPWQHFPLPITEALYLSILSDLSRPVPIPDISRKNCVTDNIVRGVLDSIDIPKCPVLPEILCVDDFRGSAGVYNPKKKRWDAPVFQTCVVDGAAGKIIDVLRDRSAATVQGYFLSFPESQRENVKFFSCDMSGIYATAATSVRNWKENILNSFIYNVSNGPVEALNSQIKRLKKISCGVHDFGSFRKRILLCFGTTSFVDNQFTIFGEKRSRKISIRKEDLNHDQ